MAKTPPLFVWRPTLIKSAVRVGEHYTYHMSPVSAFYDEGHYTRNNLKPCLVTKVVLKSMLGDDEHLFEVLFLDGFRGKAWETELLDIRPNF